VSRVIWKVAPRSWPDEVRAELKALGIQLQGAISRASGLNKAHLEDLDHRIQKALEGGGTDGGL